MTTKYSGKNSLGIGEREIFRDRWQLLDTHYWPPFTQPHYPKMTKKGNNPTISPKDDQKPSHPTTSPKDVKKKGNLCQTQEANFFIVNLNILKGRREFTFSSCLQRENNLALWKVHTSYLSYFLH